MYEKKGKIYKKHKKFVKEILFLKSVYTSGKKKIPHLEVCKKKLTKMNTKKEL